ncbi:hypothetical protein [Cellulomonas taurus]|uniref:hypothetical protein n=1 Tax=Cellulomonas taurus TaxID=2729175 RepID=UPI00145E2DC8|nr:hypothetical protein [Cellulomonas taurus]
MAEVEQDYAWQVYQRALQYLAQIPQNEDVLRARLSLQAQALDTKRPNLSRTTFDPFLNDDTVRENAMQLFIAALRSKPGQDIYASIAEVTEAGRTV